MNTPIKVVINNLRVANRPKPPKALPKPKQQYDIKRKVGDKQNIYAKYFDNNRAFLVPIMITDPETGTSHHPALNEQIISNFIATLLPYPNHSFITIVNKVPHKTDGQVEIKDFNAKNINDQYWKILESYEQPVPDFYVFPRNEQFDNQDYFLKDAVDGNCVLNEVEKDIEKINNVKNRMVMRNKLTALKLQVEHGDGSFTKEHMKVIQKMGIPMTIYHNGGIWEMSIPTIKPKLGKIEIFAHNGHATRHIPLAPVKSVNYIERPGWNGSQDWFITNEDLPHQQTKIFGSSINVSTENPLNSCSCVSTGQDWLETGVYVEPVKCNCKKDHPPVLTSQLNITAYQTGSTLNKCYRPPAPYDQDPEYFHCTNELSFEFKKFVNTHGFAPLTGIFNDIAKAADHHLTNQQFKEFVQSEIYHSADMNKAYRSFQKSRYYSSYGIPTGNPNLVKFTDKKTEQICKLGGWSRISNIRHVYPLIDEQHTHWIQEGGWYWHATLMYILNRKLALFDIDYTMTTQTEHIEFPFKQGNTPEDKKFNNRFIGKLIQKQSNRQIYTARDENELGAIIATSMANPDYRGHITYANNIVEIDFAPSTANTGLHHIHSAILSYVQIEMIEAMCIAGVDTIITYNTDGFTTTTKAPLPYTDELFGFKYAESHIKGAFKKQPDVHTVLDHPTFIPTANSHTTHTYSYGPAGCGKSRQVIVNTYHDAIFLFPTHTLTADGSIKAQGARLPLPCMTVQKYYFNNPHKKQRIYANVYIDEVSMISKQFFDKIMQHARKHRYNVHFIGDIDEQGLHQLPPVNNKDLVATPLKWSDFDGFHRELIVGDIRRQSKEDCVILDSLRGLDHDEQLAILKKHVQSITQFQAVDSFTESSIALVGTNKRGAELNSMIYRKNMPQIRVRTTKKYNDLVKGQMTLIDRCKAVCTEIAIATDFDNGQYLVNKQELYLRKESNVKSPFTLELMYAGTVDAVQGCTFEGKIFIDTNSMDRENLLYTAATRCKKLSDVYLIY